VGTGLCLTTATAGYEGPINAVASSSSNSQYFIIQNTPTTGEVFLHHYLSDRCLYVDNTVFDPYTWGCWNDPNMYFAMEVVTWASSGVPAEVYLRHIKTGTCLEISSGTVAAQRSPVQCQSPWYLYPVANPVTG